MKHAFVTFALGLTLCGGVAASQLGHPNRQETTAANHNGAVTLAYSDPQQSDFQGETDSQDVQEELLDLYTEQIMDMQRALDLLNLQLQLADVLIDAQKEQILGLQNSLESVKRLADARVEAERARCPKCLKPWLNWTTRVVAFGVGGVAGRGSCDFGN